MSLFLRRFPTFIIVVHIVVLEVESPARDLLDGCHPDLADPHLVHDFQLHALLEGRADRFVDLVVEVGGDGPGAGQPFH